MDPVCAELEQGQAPHSVLRDHKALSQHEKNERGAKLQAYSTGTGTEPVQLWAHGTTLALCVGGKSNGGYKIKSLHLSATKLHFLRKNRSSCLDKQRLLHCLLNSTKLYLYQFWIEECFGLAMVAPFSLFYASLDILVLLGLLKG